jgi:cell division septal protein FtsQ
MGALRKALIVTASCVVLLAAGYGIHGAMRSPLFLVQVVEITDPPEDAPIDAQEISRLADVPVGQVNLFDLDLRSVERRLMKSPWIKEVRLTKRFPQTLAISVVFREPKALHEGEGGVLNYVDANGQVFGPLTLAYRPDLPVVSGTRDLKSAVAMLASCESALASSHAQISSLAWDAERGYRALVVYPKGRTMVTLGRDTGPILDEQLSRLSRVFQYLSENSVPARQIFADSGKKIVVKTARGS